ncbi:LacI family DNA-binding transcriptional regulator [Primorskyibacter marinus]|uniref:LacI family DNA-binding transcriptional regulator n=1 Tax=Primorskyibacter marinus TaxID=1977320 RepID=UPI000E3080AF|nr:LacI family DNA-binding transcriptional regulator [Primorskyibacter marinus]
MAQGDNRKVTLKNVSKASGLSLTTVSRALRQPKAVHADTRAKLLGKFSGPVVEAWNLRDSAIDSAVGFDNYAASVEMTRSLIERGSENIVMVGGAAHRNDQTEDRTPGFVDAMRGAGCSVTKDTIVEDDSPATIEGGGALIQRLMARKDKPDAIFFLGPRRNA